MKIGQRGSSSGGINASAIASTIIKYSRKCFSVFNFSTWIIDLGASEHICFDVKSFVSLVPLPVQIGSTLPNSCRIIVTHAGTVSILPKLTLLNVLHVPDFKYNLISVHKLCNQYQRDLSFTPSGCILPDPLMKNTQAFGKVEEGLYFLQPTRLKSKSFNNRNLVSFKKRSNSVSKSSSVSFLVSTNAIFNIDVWHVRLGHVP